MPGAQCAHAVSVPCWCALWTPRMVGRRERGRALQRNNTAAKTSRCVSALWCCCAFDTCAPRNTVCVWCSVCAVAQMCRSYIRALMTYDSLRATITERTAVCLGRPCAQTVPTEREQLHSVIPVTGVACHLLESGRVGPELLLSPLCREQGKHYSGVRSLFESLQTTQWTQVLCAVSDPTLKSGLLLAHLCTVHLPMQHHCPHEFRATGLGSLTHLGRTADWHFLPMLKRHPAQCSDRSLPHASSLRTTRETRSETGRQNTQSQTQPTTTRPWTLRKRPVTVLTKNDVASLANFRSTFAQKSRVEVDCLPDLGGREVPLNDE